ncbi:MAG: hypothetical protein JNL40_01695 [Cyclobacteriaceae bacterium]|nr:hypothetical protein [Cyclobacteriaceae bacterium]
MSKPAFIVDGFMEKEIIQRLCPGRPISRTDLNGKSVTIEAICKKVATFVRMWGNRYYPIIVLVDKEARNMNFDEMAEALRECLFAQGLHGQDIRVGVANRMIENWILADWETLAGGRKKPVVTEGVNGTSVIRSLKGSYGKTTDGVEFFLNARQEIMYENSESYRHFVNQLDGIDCPYLDFRKVGL